MQRTVLGYAKERRKEGANGRTKIKWRTVTPARPCLAPGETIVGNMYFFAPLVTLNLRCVLAVS